MIIAPVRDPSLRTIIRRAALPVEDVFHELHEVRSALRFGYPRLLICRAGNQKAIRDLLPLGQGDVPILALAQPTLRSWAKAWGADGLAVSPLDDSALRLRQIIRCTAANTDWVERVFADLTQAIGRGLPLEFRGFARRVLEFPLNYSSVEALGETAGLSPGALKARFRRKGLPSPSRYLRWLRLLAAAQVLSDPRETILTASFRLGFASDGNFCRWVRATSGLSPSLLREWNGRLLVVMSLVQECLPESSLDGWRRLGGVFLRDVA